MYINLSQPKTKVGVQTSADGFDSVSVILNKSIGFLLVQNCPRVPAVFRPVL